MQMANLSMTNNNMRLKKAVIYHPVKNILQNNNFNIEMQSLADLLWQTGAYDEIRLLHGKQDLAIYDEIWCSCFLASVEAESLQDLKWRQVLFYVANDPEFFELPECIIERINYIAFCGSDKAYYEHLWQDKPVISIDLWQNMFRGKRAKLQNLDEYIYDLGYAGNERSQWRIGRLNLLRKDINSKIIGCAGNAKLPLVESQTEMRLCLSQLVIGDLSHKGLFPYSHRLLQGLTLSPFIFIDSALCDDLGDDLLSQWFVVDTAEQIASTIAMLKKHKEFRLDMYNRFSQLLNND